MACSKQNTEASSPGPGQLGQPDTINYKHTKPFKTIEKTRENYPRYPITLLLGLCDNPLLERY